jgi:protein-S-isoprenylcysteine O-methyltransferase Ste14
MTTARTISRSTPRVRVTVAVLAATIGLVAVAERALLAGVAGALVQLAGVAIVVVAALGRVWTSAFIAGRKDASLVRSGPYSAVRHPLYSLSMLAMLGLGLAARSVSVTVALCLFAAVVYARAARQEDSLLAERHDDAHAEFVARTPAFWPDAASYTVPDSIELRPRVFWKAFLDAGSLIGIALLLCAVDVLQRSGVTPTILTLP